MKKLLSVVLAVAIVFCIVPFSASAQYNDEYAFSIVFYEIDGEYQTYISGVYSADGVYKDVSGDIIIPSKISGYDIVGISNNAFSDCDKITSITIGEGIKVIADYAFEGCKALKNINFNTDLQSIGFSAFSGCESLTEIVLPYGLESIGEYAFWGCDNLSVVNMASNVSYIGEYAFEYCASLKHFGVAEDNASYCAVDGVLFDKSMQRLMNYPACKAGKEYVIPSSVKSIDEAAFEYSRNLEYVSIPEGVETIARCTFNNCRTLKKVDLPSTLKTIGYMAFHECHSLETLNIPDGVTHIDKYVFHCCYALSSVVLPKSVKTIGGMAFYWCSSLKDVWYEGDAIDRSIMSVGELNTEFFNAKWHYSTCKSDAHVYDNICDGSCNKCSWTRQAHDFENACDLVCETCGTKRSKTEHSHEECFDGYESNLETLGEWNCTPSETAIYDIEPRNYTAGFSGHYLVVTDALGNEVKYNQKQKGWPLVAGQNYTLNLRYQYNDANVSDLIFALEKVSNTAFPDTASNAWYSDAVTYAVGRGVISGYANGKFGTSDGIQRQDFLVMLARLDGVNLAFYVRHDNTFPDIVRNSYYENAIMWGYTNGIVTGYQNGNFGVGDKITREQIVTFLYRYAQYKGEYVGYTTEQKQAVERQYTDFNKVSAFSKDAIIWAVSNGVINGKTPTTIVPQGTAQRCEVAQIIYNMYLSDVNRDDVIIPDDEPIAPDDTPNDETEDNDYGNQSPFVPI